LGETTRTPQKKNGWKATRRVEKGYKGGDPGKKMANPFGPLGDRITKQKNKDKHLLGGWGISGSENPNKKKKKKNASNVTLDSCFATTGHPRWSLARDNTNFPCIQREKQGEQKKKKGTRKGGKDVMREGKGKKNNFLPEKRRRMVQRTPGVGEGDGP